MSTDNDDDAPRIALLTLYAPRHALLRFDVAPFACGYVLCLALFFAVPSREVSANVAMPLLVCAHLLVFLVSHWSLSVLCALKLRRVSTVASATLIHVVPATAGAGLATPPSELCALVRRPRYSPEATAGAAASAEETRFEFHKTAFVLHAKGEGGAKADAEAEAEGVRAGDGLFVQLRMPVGREAAFYLQARGYRDAASVAAAEYVFGANACHIPERSFVDLFKEQALAPFFVFQVVCVMLWSLDDYWYYSLFTLLMLVVFEATVVKSRMRNTDEMRSMSNPASRCTVLRHGKWTALSSEALLPGDLLSISRAPPVHGEPVTTLLPADVLLLHGTAVVNESALTGESTPQRKAPLDSLGLEPDERVALSTHRACLLLAGTKLLQHSSGAQPRSLQPPQQGAALGVVVRTAFQSSQGALMRTILFSSQRATGNTKEVLVFILFLLVFALAAAAHVLHHGLQDESRCRWKLLLHCCMIVTSVVPPELPMELSLAVNHSLLALHRVGIYCTEPFRIPFAGRLHFCCFDKTGTLTSDEMSVLGVAGVQGTAAAAEGTISAISAISATAAVDSTLVSAAEVPEQTSLVLAGCQQLVLVDGELLGDPMERAALQAAGWLFASEGVCVNRDPSRRASLRIVQRYPFSSDLRRSATIAALEHRGPRLGAAPRTEGEIASPPRLAVLAKGAPEAMRALLATVPEGYDEAYMHHVRLGRRVLALGSKPLQGGEAEARALTRSEAERGLSFCGFLVLHCPPKPESAAVLEALRASSHELQMITGDQLLTACQAACELRLVSRPVLLLTAPPATQAAAAAGGAGADVLAGLRWEHWRSEAGTLGGGGTATAGKAGKGAKAAKGAGGLTRRKTGGGRRDGEAVGAAAGEAAAADAAAEAAASQPPPPFDPSASAWQQLGAKFDLCVSGDVFAALGAAGLLTMAVPHLRVMARMAPAQKQAALAALRLAGLPALMCGDGTNDVGALKAADVGVALVSASLVGPPPPSPDDGMFAEGGKGGKGRAESLEESLREMDGPMLKLGDASIAAAFTARSASVTSCVSVILQGRCTLVTTIQMFQILALNCLVSAYGLSVLHLRGVRMGDTQATATGIATALFFLFVSGSRPLHRLSPRRPPASVLAPYVFFSVLAQFAVHLGLLMQATRLGAEHEGSTPPEPDAEFEPSVLNTVVWLVSAAMMVSTFAVNYKGKPYMEGLSANKGLLITLGSSALALAGLTSGSLAGLSEYLELVPLPSEELRSDLMGLMAADFCLCWLFDKLLTKAFAY